MGRPKTKARFPGYRSFKAKGKLYQYVRPVGDGDEIPIRAEPGSVEWEREYLAARGGTSIKPIARRVSGAGEKMLWPVAVERYLASSTFLELAPTTRDGRGRDLRRIAALCPDSVLGELFPENIAELFAEHSPNSRERYVIGIRMLYRFHKLKDPTFSDDFPKEKRRRSKGFKTAKADVIEAFRATWPVGSLERALFEMNFGTTQRKADLIRLRKGPNPDDPWSGGSFVSVLDPDTGKAYVSIAVTQQKTGSMVLVPVPPEAIEALDAYEAEKVKALAAVEARYQKWLSWPSMANKARRTYESATARRYAEPDLIFRTPKTLFPLTPATYSEVMRAAFIKAGLPVYQKGMSTYENAYSGHSLRKGGLSEIAIAGGTHLQLQATGGHVTSAQVDHYIRDAEKLRAAIIAYEKRQALVAKQKAAKERQAHAASAGASVNIVRLDQEGRNRPGSV